jgi:hypothetical protein
VEEDVAHEGELDPCETARWAPILLLLFLVGLSAGRLEERLFLRVRMACG